MLRATSVIRREFTNIYPRQIATIPWGWKNRTDDDGNTFVVEHPGVIPNLDLTEYFDWKDFMISGSYVKDSFGTLDMKSIFTTTWRFLGEEAIVQPWHVIRVASMFARWNDHLIGMSPVPIGCYLIGDDYAGNTGLILGPQTWTTWIAPALSLLIAPTKERSMKIWLHSDGDIYEILPFLSGLGFHGISYQPVGKMAALTKEDILYKFRLLSCVEEYEEGKKEVEWKHESSLP
jgi:hypothetical protein